MDSIPIDFTLERNRLESPMLWGSSGAEIESFTIGHFLYHETYEPKPCSTSLHSHENIYELSVMRNGEMEYKIGNRNICISAENGDFICIPPGVKHIRLCFEKGARINGFQFELLARKASGLQNKRFEKTIVKNNYHFKGSEEVRQNPSKIPGKPLGFSLRVKCALTARYLSRARPQASAVANAQRHTGKMPVLLPRKNFAKNICRKKS